MTFGDFHSPTTTTQLAGRALANELGIPQREDVVSEFLHEHVKADMSAAKLGFACFFGLRLGNGLMCAASHEPFEERRGHERSEDCHDHERGEKSL